MKTLPRPHPLIALLGCFLLSACIFGNSPAKLNQMVEDGEAARALTAIEEKLTGTPDDPTLNLLAIKARLALCHQRNCTAENPTLPPPLLAGLPKLAGHVTGPVRLEKDTPPLTLQGVFGAAMAQYQLAPGQPAAVLALYRSAPASVQPALASGLFQPALVLARQGSPHAAGQALSTVAAEPALPPTYTYAAHMLGAMFGFQRDNKTPNLIALRSTKAPPLPAGAAALLPWALLAEAAASPSPTSPANVLATLPRRLADLQLPALLDAGAMSAIAAELVAASNNPSMASQWQPSTDRLPNLTMQRMALLLNPNQPELWASFLPALVSATIENSASLAGFDSLQVDAGATLPAATLSSATAPRVAAEVIRAATRLSGNPSVATPLVMFASRIPLSNQQQIDLEKLSQSLIIRAAEQGDITSTLVLAQTLPGVAQNNRQSVVPLLVKFIRGNLRDGNFDAAVNTAGFLTGTLKMDVEFAPLVLEEFADDLKRREVAAALNADKPDVLLKPADEVILDLGPLFTFMQSYFQDQPKVISAQLTTLISAATGIYGQATAMYRLGSYFPASILPPERQQEWLAASLEQALLADPALTATTLADTAARLKAIHPSLNLAPLLETAIRRAGNLEDQRTLWQNSTPAVRDVLRAIRPEFTMLMQGIDALAAGQLNTAAQSFSAITDGAWKAEAAPFLEQFNERLVTLSGVYVPVSAAPALKAAAIILAPQGLWGGKLNSVSVTFISRVGTLAEPETATLRTNAAASHRFGLALPYNFDTRSIAVQPQTVAQAPQGGTFAATYGNIRSLKLQGEGDSSILGVTLADGSTTPFLRTLLDPAQPLRPDGTYLLQSRMGNAASPTQAILPPGSLITLAMSDALQPAPPEADTATAQVYPLSGTVRHPASAQPIAFNGWFDPEFFTSTFQFSYPLPSSAQPARAVVRCQALAGPITCGAHNLNSARQAYAALVTGLQTRESLAASAAQRANLNSLASGRILADAASQLTAPTSTSTTLSVSGTGGLLAPPSLTIPASPTLGVAAALTASPTVAATPSTAQAAPSATTAPSPTAALAPAAPSPTAPADEEAAAPEQPAAPKPIPPSTTTPETGGFLNYSGTNAPVSPTKKP